MYPFFTYHTCAVTQVGSTSTAGPNLKYACSQPAFVAHRDVVVVTNAQLHPTKSDSDSAQIQTLLPANRSFAMVRTSYNGNGWK